MTCYLCGGNPAIVDTGSASYGMCSSCSARAEASRKECPRPKHTPTHRVCSKCRRTLPNDGFTWRKSGTPFSACKGCNKGHYAAKRRAIKKAQKETTK